MVGQMTEMRPYVHRKSELTVQYGILMWGIRVVIPPSLRADVLKELHVSHPGVCRMKMLARSHVWWPGIDRELEEVSKSCKNCQEVKASPPRAPLHPWPWPKRPWERVHADFAGPFSGSMFSLLIDSHKRNHDGHICPS